MKTLLILSAALLQGCAHSDPWTRTDTVLQSVYTLALVVDAMQTSDIQYHPGQQEYGLVARQVLGPVPSTSDTWQYVGTLAVTNYLITRALPKKWRPFWQGANIADHSRMIIRNCHYGLGSFCKRLPQTQAEQ